MVGRNEFDLMSEDGTDVVDRHLRGRDRLLAAE